MRKRVIFGSLVLIVLLFIVTGCNEADYSGDFPPEPAPPYSEPNADVVRNLAGQASYPFEVGFSSPYDVYEEDAAKQQLFFLTKNDVDLLGFEEDTFTFPVKVEHPGGVVYKYGYVYTIPRGWERYEFPQPGFRGSKWIVTKAETTLALNRADFEEGTNWIVAYSCKKQAGKWRCGMQQKDGAGNVWMLQSFTVRNVGAPAEPSALENVCTDTDGGKVAGTRGTTTGIFVDGTTRVGGSATDECVAGTNKVKEWYCIAPTTLPTRAFEEVECANGCANGICLAPPPDTCNNGQLDTGESCDGTLAASGQSLTCPVGYSGSKTCTNCQIVDSCVAPATPATTFAVCRVPLKKFGGERTVWTQPIGTTLTPQAACAQYKVFGTAAKEPFAVAEADLSEARIVTTTDSLECKVPCVGGREAIQTCKYLGMVPDDTNPADANAQFNLDPLSKCS